MDYDNELEYEIESDQVINEPLPSEEEFLELMKQNGLVAGPPKECVVVDKSPHIKKRLNVFLRIHKNKQTQERILIGLLKQQNYLIGYKSHDTVEVSHPIHGKFVARLTFGPITRNFISFTIE